MITFDMQEKKFSIQLPNASYFLQIDANGALRNLYWGKKITNSGDVMLEMPIADTSYSRTYPYREEYIARGKASFDEPCILVEFADGTRDARLIYKSHNIKKLVREELSEHGISHVTIELEAAGEHCHETDCHVEHCGCSGHHHHHHHHHGHHHH